MKVWYKNVASYIFMQVKQTENLFFETLMVLFLSLFIFHVVN